MWNLYAWYTAGLRLQKLYNLNIIQRVFLVTQEKRLNWRYTNLNYRWDKYVMWSIERKGHMWDTYIWQILTFLRISIEVWIWNFLWKVMYWRLGTQALVCPAGYPGTRLYHRDSELISGLSQWCNLNFDGIWRWWKYQKADSSSRKRT